MPRKLEKLCWILSVTKIKTVMYFRKLDYRSGDSVEVTTVRLFSKERTAELVNCGAGRGR